MTRTGENCLNSVTRTGENCPHSVTGRCCQSLVQWKLGRVRTGRKPGNTPLEGSTAEVDLFLQHERPVEPRPAGPQLVLSERSRRLGRPPSLSRGGCSTLRFSSEAQMEDKWLCVPLGIQFGRQGRLSLMENTQKMPRRPLSPIRDRERCCPLSSRERKPPRKSVFAFPALLRIINR